MRRHYAYFAAQHRGTSTLAAVLFLATRSRWHTPTADRSIATSFHGRQPWLTFGQFDVDRTRLERTGPV
jgi:hypothetical protein